MIKNMIRTIYRPLQIISDNIRRRRNQRMMMTFVLKIEPSFTHCAAMKE